MSNLENQTTQSAEAVTASDTFVLGHISQLIANLQADGSDPGSVYRRLFTTINEHYRPLVSKIDLRDRAAQYNDAYESSKLSGSSLIEVGSIAVSETLAEAICEEAPVFRLNSLDAQRQYVTIGLPVRNGSQTDTIGAISVALVPRSQADINALVAELNSLVLAASGCIEVEDVGPVGQTNTDWARVLTRVAKMGDSREFAFTLVNTLAERFDCGKVGLGLIRKRRVVMRAISGLASFKSNSPGVADMLQAMEECYDRKEVVTCAHGEEVSSAMPIHRIWGEKTNSAIISLPLKLEDDTLAIVTLQRTSDRPFEQREIEGLQEMLAPFAPPLLMIEKSGRSILQHLRDDGRSAIQPWIKPKTLARQSFMVAAFVGFMWFCFGSITYRPVCESILTPASVNHMAVPFDAKIETVHVSSGDRVQAGQVLLTLDKRALELEKNQLTAEMQSAKVQVSQGVSQRDAAVAALANAQVGVLQTKLDSVKAKIQQCTLRAQSDGLVIDANLRKRIGQTLPQGEQLLSFAPGDQWVVEVRVPDGVSPYIAPTQNGTFRSYSHPDQTFDCQIRSVSGSAEVIDGKNVFVADASLADQADWMKAGMQGICRVEAVSKPVWWVALHGLLDRLQMRFWL